MTAEKLASQLGSSMVNISFFNFAKNMISYKDFNAILVDLNRKIENDSTLERNEDNRYYFDDFLLCSIKVWCDYLHIDPIISQNISNWAQENQPKNFIRKTFDEWKPEEQYMLPLKKHSNLYKFLENNFFKNNVHIDDENFVVILAFVVTSIGYLLYAINQGSIHPSTGTSQTNTPLPCSIQQKKINQALVLVVNALKSDIVKTIQRQNKITSDDCEGTYRATESLWMGLPNQISPQLRECFSSSNSFKVSEGEESEYDIYLIQIELKESDDGFKPLVDQLTRIDAFNRLSDLALNIKISDRLRVNAYESTGVYRR